MQFCPSPVLTEQPCDLSKCKRRQRSQPKRVIRSSYRCKLIYLSVVLSCRVALAREMVVYVLFGGYGHAVSRSRPKVPVVEYRYDLLIYSMTQPLKQLRFHNISLRIYGDLHDHIALYAVRKL